MDLSNTASFIAIPKEKWETLERDVYNILRKLDTLSSNDNQSVDVEWIPLHRFLELVDWSKTTFYDKRKSGRFPDTLVLKPGERKVFIHKSALDKFFAGDFD